MSSAWVGVEDLVLFVLPDGEFVKNGRWVWRFGCRRGRSRVFEESTDLRLHCCMAMCLVFLNKRWFRNSSTHSSAFLFNLSSCSLFYVFFVFVFILAPKWEINKLQCRFSRSFFFNLKISVRSGHFGLFRWISAGTESTDKCRKILPFQVLIAIYLNRATHRSSPHFVSSLSNLALFSSSFLLHLVLSVFFFSLYIFLVIRPFVYSVTLHFFSLSFVFWHLCSNFLVLWATPRD